MSFNTASGKYCCNSLATGAAGDSVCSVSIPQAVSTVATQNQEAHMIVASTLAGFNTASGKYCCNVVAVVGQASFDLEFQYRKR